MDNSLKMKPLTELLIVISRKLDREQCLFPLENKDLNGA